MTIKITAIRSFLAPVWQEIRSLGAGIDFPLYEFEQEVPIEHLPGSAQNNLKSGRCTGQLEHCW
jgi:hypothetical protein